MLRSCISGTVCRQHRWLFMLTSRLAARTARKAEREIEPKQPGGSCSFGTPVGAWHQINRMVRRASHRKIFYIVKGSPRRATTVSNPEGYDDEVSSPTSVNRPKAPTEEGTTSPHGDAATANEHVRRVIVPHTRSKSSHTEDGMGMIVN